MCRLVKKATGGGEGEDDGRIYNPANKLADDYKARKTHHPTLMRASAFLISN
jgi:hypothetical protein